MQRLLLFFLLAGSALAAKGDWRFYYNEGLSHYQAQRYENALYYFERAAEKNADNAIIFRAIGHCNRELKKPYASISAYEKSLALNRKQPDLLLTMGDFYTTKRNYKRAQLMYGRYYNQKKDNDEANFKYALSLARNGQRDRASQLMGALSQPNSAVRTECLNYSKAKLHKKAYECWRKLSLLNPADAENLLALVHLEEKQLIQPSRSENWAESLFLLHGQNERFAWPLFYQYYRAKKFTHAARVLKQIEKISANKALVHFMRAELLREQEKGAAADQAYEKALKN